MYGEGCRVCLQLLATDLARGIEFDICDRQLLAGLSSGFGLATRRIAPLSSVSSVYIRQSRPDSGLGLSPFSGESPSNLLILKPFKLFLRGHRVRHTRSSATCWPACGVSTVTQVNRGSTFALRRSTLVHQTQPLNGLVSEFSSATSGSFTVNRTSGSSTVHRTPNTALRQPGFGVRLGFFGGSEQLLWGPPPYTVHHTQLLTGLVSEFGSAGLRSGFGSASCGRTPRCWMLTFGFRVQGLRCMVNKGSGFRIQSSGFRDHPLLAGRFGHGSNLGEN